MNKCKIKMPHDFPDFPCKKCNSSANFEWRLKHQAITGETRKQTIERIIKGKTKFGKILKSWIK